MNTPTDIPAIASTGRARPEPPSSSTVVDVAVGESGRRVGVEVERDTDVVGSGATSGGPTVAVVLMSVAVKVVRM